MPQTPGKRLTDNQRITLSKAMQRYDQMLCDLYRKAKDSNDMVRPEEKLSQNLDFKKRLLEYHARFEKNLQNNGVMIPIFEEATKSAMVNVGNIVAGQSRSDLRHWIDRYRCDLLHRMETDTINVIYACDGRAAIKQNS